MRSLLILRLDLSFQSAKSGKTTPGAIKRPPMKEEGAKGAADRDESLNMSGDPVLEAKYKDKVYSQVRELL